MARGPRVQRRSGVASPVPPQGELIYCHAPAQPLRFCESHWSARTLHLRHFTL